MLRVGLLAPPGPAFRLGDEDVDVEFARRAAGDPFAESARAHHLGDAMIAAAGDELQVPA